MKIAFFDAKPYDKESFEKYSKDYGASIKYYETKLNEDTAGLAKGYDAVCAFVNDTVDSIVIDKLISKGIKVIALRCAGYNNVDLKYASGKIAVLRVPAYSPHAVAEHAMALLLTWNRRIHKAYIRSRDFNFSLSGLTGFDLYGKTVGVVGTGKIGRAFVELCLGFGMNVLAYDVYPDDSLLKKSGVKYTNMDEILSLSHIISLHCPLNEETYHLINEDALKKCKEGVILINTSRGALVDAEALIEGIKNQKVGAALLDVYEEEGDVFFEDNSESIVKDDILARLISMPNVIVTSHQAFLTREALSNIAHTTLNNLKEYFHMGKCENEIIYKAN